MMNKNTFALTPPMGWNSYDYYDTAVTEADVRRNADAMHEKLQRFGYEYVVVDISWYVKHAAALRPEGIQYTPFDELAMDEYGRLLPDPNRFPSSRGGAGFKPLAGYIHSLGLKFGIHIMRGIPRAAAQNHMKVKGAALTADRVADPASICPWNPDMYGVRNCPEGQAYYDSIIELYASWGVDFIKCDDICDSRLYGENFSGWHETEMLRKAIDRCGRPIVLSLSPGPAHIDRASFYQKNANMWRITDDFWDNWKLLKPMFRRCEMWQDHVKEGCFPDCDMLPVGRIGKVFGEERMTRFTRDEQRTMMALWCLFRSPLMIGAELSLLDEETEKLLANEALLSCLKQSAHGEQLLLDETAAVWKNEDRVTGEIRIGLFNLSDEEQEISISKEEISETLTGAETLKELFGEEDNCFENGRLHASVPGHGVRVYRI